MNKAIVVLSGGQDSTTCLFWAKKCFDSVKAITFDYGQRHRIEIVAARQVARMAEVEHEIVQLVELLESTSPLVDPKAALEKYESAEQMEQVIGKRVELTFVPMRNTLFMTIAANRAIAFGANTIVTGICQEDNANYPDCTEAFRIKMEAAINESLGQKVITILAPLMFMSKSQSVHFAKSVPGAWRALAYSHTSYDGKYPPTDMNHANVLRAKGFEEAGLPDPLVVRAVNDKLMEYPHTRNYDSLREQQHPEN